MNEPGVIHQRKTIAEKVRIYLISSLDQVEIQGLKPTKVKASSTEKNSTSAKIKTVEAFQP